MFIYSCGNRIRQHLHFAIIYVSRWIVWAGVRVINDISIVIWIFICIQWILFTHQTPWIWREYSVAAQTVKRSLPFCMHPCIRPTEQLYKLFIIHYFWFQYMISIEQLTQFLHIISPMPEGVLWLDCLVNFILHLRLFWSWSVAIAVLALNFHHIGTPNWIGNGPHSNSRAKKKKKTRNDKCNFSETEKKSKALAPNIWWPALPNGAGGVTLRRHTQK